MINFCKISTFSAILIILVVCNSCKGQTEKNDSMYSFRSGDPNGIGKWYMGREISHVMGYQGISWLERESREKEEHTSRLIKNMNIQPGDAIADIGAGSGYHVFKMAPLAAEGTIYAVDIQQEMLDVIKRKKDDQNFNSIGVVKGSEKSIGLPENSVDKILMVDVYHEFSFPYEMIQSMKKALRKDGKIFLIEYRAEDPDIPIKKLHKMSEKQAIKEFDASGFKLDKNISNLPWQHCMIFIRK